MSKLKFTYVYHLCCLLNLPIAIGMLYYSYFYYINKNVNTSLIYQSIHGFCHHYQHL